MKRLECVKEKKLIRSRKKMMKEEKKGEKARK
jgi:hypothetical protein